VPIHESLIQELESIAEPGALLAELHRRFGKRMAIATSGQPTDTAIIALAQKAGVKKPRVYTTDTYRLFPETYAYFKTLERFFKIKIERFTPPEKVLTRMVEQHGEFLFYDSREKQEYCCHVRKVLPNQKALDSLDVWVTGLRRDQSASRAELPRMEIIEYPSPSPLPGERDKGEGKRRILKVNPLVFWTEKQVADYLKTNKIPNHPLFERKLPGGYYYESLGCILCTTPIGPHEPRRAGRWRWFNALDDKKECGLHLPSST
jgi:3'-phosphoadenosine 5'-phosphosulfate sulfotransferase (PAPS reductase)/FAD synthetase